MRPERIVVAYVIDSMEVGGAQRQLLSPFRGVDRARFDLRLVCLREGGAFAEQLAAEGFPVVVVGKRGHVDLRMLWRLVALLRQWRPDVVHCSVFTANLWGRVGALAAGVPVRIAHEQSSVSREAIERETGAWAVTLSCPSGRWNQAVIASAQQRGFRAVFTSAPDPSVRQGEVTVAGRVAVRSRWDAGRMRRFLENQQAALRRMRRTQRLREAAQRLLGDRIYESVHGICWRMFSG